MPNKDYKEERREYKFSQLNREDIHLDPFLQFNEWLDIAHNSTIKDPTAMTLSTVDANLQPHSRIVLLKEIDKGLVFYTHYESQKGQDLAQNPKASVLFFWPEQDRQISIEGIIEKTSPEISQTYFQSRPLDSQLAATISKQSQIVPGRKTLELNFLIAENNYNGEQITCPEHWGGYILKPTLFEFWQGRENRLHDRFQYTKDLQNNQAWSISRLSP